MLTTWYNHFKNENVFKPMGSTKHFYSTNRLMEYKVSRVGAEFLTLAFKIQRCKRVNSMLAKTFKLYMFYKVKCFYKYILLQWKMPVYLEHP